MKSYKVNEKKELTKPYAMEAGLRPDQREPETEVAEPDRENVKDERDWSIHLKL